MRNLGTAPPAVFIQAVNQSIPPGLPGANAVENQSAAGRDSVDPLG